MTCQSCGAPLNAGVRFCPRCGAVVGPEQQVQGSGAASDPRFAGAQPAAAYGSPQYAYGAPVAVSRPPRVATHVRTLGILWVCFGVWRVLSGLAGMFFLSSMTAHRFWGWGTPWNMGHRGFPPEWMGWMLPLIAGGTVIAAALAFGTGYALLNRTSWGRILAIVAGILALFKFPLGTALGIYTLWVLLPAPSGAEYDHLAATTGS